MSKDLMVVGDEQPVVKGVRLSWVMELIYRLPNNNMFFLSSNLHTSQAGDWPGQPTSQILRLWWPGNEKNVFEIVFWTCRRTMQKKNWENSNETTLKLEICNHREDEGSVCKAIPSELLIIPLSFSLCCQSWTDSTPSGKPPAYLTCGDDCWGVWKTANWWRI